MSALVALERTRLATEEAVIERGLHTFVQVGKALAAIRDQRLYRESHGTFEDYCREKWDISDSRARQLIGAARTVTNVTAHGGPAPSTESQARELSGLEPEAAADVMREADEATEGKPTAAAIRAARDIPQPDDLPDATPGESDGSPDGSDPIGDAKAKAKASPVVLGGAAMVHLEKAHRDIVRAGGPEAICADNDTTPLAGWNRELWVDLLARLTPLIDAWAAQLGDRAQLRRVK